MSLRSDLRILYHIALKPVRGDTHQQRLESFYGGQAADYDAFRKRLLQGREALYRAMPRIDGGVWLDLGGGTGANLDFVPEETRAAFRKIHVVDLSESLLEIARRRIADRGWDNADALCADVTDFEPPEGEADVVTFSYSLTMIPDWFAAIDRAKRLLKSGGTIGVVDFTVARKHPASDLRKHSWLTRTFWPAWFASDNVFLSPDHLPYLRRHFETVDVAEERARTPYMFWAKMPYYRFVGRKRHGQT